VNKHIDVFTNDPDHPRTTLKITGKVLNFALVEPSYARLVGRAGTDIKKTVTIIREKAFPFKILKAKARNGKDIAIDMHEFTDAGKNGYTLTIENKMKKTGRYADAVILTTDSKIRPTIIVPVYGQIVSITPRSVPSQSGKNTSGG
jgi:hypothetical protein